MSALLLHACCAPCSLEPVRHLREEGFEPTICWFNPNIQPRTEHDRRLGELRRWCMAEHLRLLKLPEHYEAWERHVAPIGARASEKRCRACYALRLKAAVDLAKEEGFSHVATTLAVSPYQWFEVCNDILSTFTAAQGLTALIRDWRPWYGEATRRSRELGMYRQQYCGCRFSAAEAAIERAERRRAGKSHALCAHV